MYIPTLLCILIIPNTLFALCVCTVCGSWIDFIIRKLAIVDIWHRFDIVSHKNPGCKMLLWVPFMSGKCQKMPFLRLSKQALYVMWWAKPNVCFDTLYIYMHFIFNVFRMIEFHVEAIKHWCYFSSEFCRTQ